MWPRANSDEVPSPSSFDSRIAADTAAIHTRTRPLLEGGAWPGPRSGAAHPSRGDAPHEAQPAILV